MKISSILSLSAVYAVALGAIIGKREEEIDVRFYRFQNDICQSPGEIEAVKTIMRNGECHTYPEGWHSFWYQADHHHIFWWRHNDFSSPRCSVVVFGEPSCLGKSYSPGTYPVTKNECAKANFKAYSARVDCSGDAPAGDHNLNKSEQEATSGESEWIF